MTISEASLIADLAAYVLHGEDCPARCVCASEDGTHRPTVAEDLTALTLFVRQAREVALAEPGPLEKAMTDAGLR